MINKICNVIFLNGYLRLHQAFKIIIIYNTSRVKNPISPENHILPYRTITFFNDLEQIFVISLKLSVNTYRDSLKLKNGI